MNYQTRFVLRMLDLLTEYLNTQSEFFKNSNDKDVVALYDKCKDLAAWARSRSSL
jgi:hypothetical protein